MRGDKHICLENYGVFIQDKIYIIETLSKPTTLENSIVQIFSLEDQVFAKFLGGYSRDIMRIFITLAEFREQRINKILDESIS
jgi:hypothetical protein